MSEHEGDLIVLAAGAVLVVAGLGLRRHGLFVLLFCVVVVAYGWLAPAAARPLDRGLALTGLGLLGPGLLGIRLILVRSVSVRMLEGQSNDAALRIGRRTREVVRLGLAREREQGLVLTRRGRWLARLVHALYAVCGHLE